MEAIIVYHSKYGATRSIAEEIADRLPMDAAARSLREVDADELERSRLIAVGAPIYGGTISARVVRFCERHRDVLLEKRIGLFISCFYRDERAAAQIETNYPDWLRAHASVRDWLGGRIVSDRLSFFDRFLLSRLGGARDIDDIRHARIERFSRDLAADASA